MTTAHFPGNAVPTGFYSLMVILEDETALDGAARQRARSTNKLFAAVHLEWLAVAKPLHGNGIGRYLLASAIEQFALVATIAGIPFMTVASIDQRTCEFYEKLGFKRFCKPDTSTRMLLPAQDALELTKILANGG